MIPKGFFPLQDTGFRPRHHAGAPDISYGDMVKKHLAMAEIVAADPAVAGVRACRSALRAATRPSPTDASGSSLKERGDRDVSASEFIDRIRPQLVKVPGIVLYLRAGAGHQPQLRPEPRAQYQYVLKSSDGDAAERPGPRRLTEKLRSNPAFRDISNDLQLGGSITHITHRPQRRGALRPDRQRRR